MLTNPHQKENTEESVWHLYEVIISNSLMWMKIQASCQSSEQAMEFFEAWFGGEDPNPPQPVYPWHSFSIPTKLSQRSDRITNWASIVSDLPPGWDDDEFRLADGPYPWCEMLSDDCDCHGSKGGLDAAFCSDFGTHDETQKRTRKSQNARRLNYIREVEEIIARRDERWREERASRQKVVYAAPEQATPGRGQQEITDPVARLFYRLVSQGLYCQIDGRHHVYSDVTKHRTAANLVAVQAQASTWDEKQRSALMSQIGGLIAHWLQTHQSQECAERAINGEADIPEILYKYIPRGRIGNGAPDSLRATQLLALNDEMECNVVAMNNSDQGTVEFLDLVRSKLSEHLGLTVPRDELLERSLRHADPRLSTYIQQHLNSRVGVVSFTTDLLVPTMWAHYARNTGIVVGYDTEILRNMGFELRPVTYAEFAPSYEPAKDDVIRQTIVDRERLEMEAKAGNDSTGYVTLCDVDLAEFGADWKALSRVLFVKGASWAYEKEVRLLVDLEQATDIGMPDNNGHPVKVIAPPPEAIREIYRGANTLEADVARAVEAARGENKSGLFVGHVTSHAFRIQKTGGVNY